MPELLVSHRLVVSHIVPDPEPPANAPVVVIAKYEPSGAKSTSRVNVSKTPAQLLCARSNRLVNQPLSDELVAPRSIIATCERVCPATWPKLPTATSLVPAALTSNRLTLVVPGLVRLGS